MKEKSSWLERKVLNPLKYTAAALVFGLGFAQGSQAQTTSQNFYGDLNFNAGIQHNILDHGAVNFSGYGSGDADGDGDVDNDDLIAMQNGTANNRTDLNWDGVTNSQDLSIANNYKAMNPNGTLLYLPSYWGFLSESEKISLVQKFINLDSTKFHLPGPNWDCQEYTNQGIVNGDGVENLNSSVYNPNIIDFSNNGKFNIPMYECATKSTANVFHSTIGVFTGDSATNLSDWTIFDLSKAGQIVTPGHSSMDPNSFVSIKKMMYHYSQNLQMMKHTDKQIAYFDLINGQDTLLSINQDVPIFPERIPTSPLTEILPADTTISLGQPTDTSNTGKVTNVNPHARISYSDSIIDFGNGNYDLKRRADWKLAHVYVPDTAAPTVTTTQFPFPHLNQTIGTQTIHVVDDEPPVVTHISDLIYMPYPAENIPNRQITATDNSGLPVAVNYVSDSLTQDSSGCGKFNYEQWVTAQLSDPAGNVTDTTFLNAIVYKPNESLVYTHVHDTTVGKWFNVTPSNLEGMVLATDVLYPQNNIVLTYNPIQTNSTSTENTYTVDVNASGDCGCSRDTSFTLTHDLINSTSGPGKLETNLYPNPTNGIVNLEGQVEGYKKLNWEVYSVEGTLVSYGAEELFGDYNVQVDLSNLMPGIYQLIGCVDGKRLLFSRIIIK